VLVAGRVRGLLVGSGVAVVAVLVFWLWFEGLDLLFGYEPGTVFATVLGVGVACVCVALILWLVPRAQIARWQRDGIEGRDLAELGNSARATLTQALGGLALVATLAITAYQVSETRKASERNIRVTEEGQATELLAHAVDQLGATTAGRISFDTRVGALYSLSRLAADPDRSTFIGQILVAYVRDNLAVAGAVSGDNKPCSSRAHRTKRKLRPDIKVALEAIAQVADEINVSPYELAPSTSELELSGASFAGMDLTGLTFKGVSLDHVSFRNAELSDSFFTDDRYGETDFRGACLRRANFLGMSGLDLPWHIDFRGADIRGALFQDLAKGDPNYEFGEQYDLRTFLSYDSSGWAVIRTDSTTVQ